METGKLIREAMTTLQSEYVAAGVMMCVTIAARLAWGEEIGREDVEAWRRLQAQIEVWGHKEEFDKILATVI